MTQFKSVSKTTHENIQNTHKHVVRELVVQASVTVVYNKTAYLSLQTGLYSTAVFETGQVIH